MAILGSIIKNTLQLRRNLVQSRKKSPAVAQQKQLLKLLRTAQYTAFGEKYHFPDIVSNTKTVQEIFRQHVPVFNYDTMHEQWWHRALEGEANVSWPGKVKYFALSSGTSGAPSKRIPVTTQMISSIKKTSLDQMCVSLDMDLPEDVYGKGALLIGGSTKLTFKHQYYEGDLSGISAKKRPLWFNRFYKPGAKISRQKNWNRKLKQIVENAPNWDIGIVVGIPAWVQLLFEQIIERHDLKTIHDIWPNLGLYIHSGVAFDPYKKAFDKMFGKPVEYLESFLSSEGFFAFQTRRNQGSMTMCLDNGIFYEFIPFDEKHFDAEGEMISAAGSCLINEVETDKDYALLISTCAGAWRYLIGDVIRFTDVQKCEIVITGRTKHFLSITGEHLSVENMSKGITHVSDYFNVECNEYTVSAMHLDKFFGHHWFIGCDQPLDQQQVASVLDKYLRTINDDYDTEREASLKEIKVDLIPNDAFLEWMQLQKKVGAQIKFPRVLKGEKLENWIQFLTSKGYLK